MKKCQFCGHKSHNYMVIERGKWACRNERACFNRVLQQRETLKTSVALIALEGAKMANLCFNLSQQEGRTLSKEVAQLMAEMYKHWDICARKASAVSR